MKVSALAREEVIRRLNDEGLSLRVEPFTVRVRSPLPRLAADLMCVYADYPVPAADEFVDFDVHVEPAAGIRRWFKRQVGFRMGHNAPFNTLPREQAFAFLEWGLNWCIHGHLNEHLIVHAAVVERGGHAVVMPGEPGAGKSTLCAGLVLRGWRLLSDELAMIVPETGDLVPVVRPVSLKNESIDVIAAFARDTAVFATRVPSTTKGAVAHLRPPRESVERGGDPARPGWLIFPRFSAGSAASLQPLSKAKAFIRAAEDAFNYSVLGTPGFQTMVEFIEASDCYEFSYGDLDEAVRLFDALTPPGGGRPSA